MRTRLRVALPSVIGILSVPLIFWDIHNAGVIESMGMDWDMGAPMWPYQASDILLRSINGPAYSVAMPIANLLRLAAPIHLLLVIPSILIWWWFLGLTLDRGLARWSYFVILVVLVTLLLWSTTTIPAIFRLRLGCRALHVTTILVILRFLTPAAWFVALTSRLCIGRKRVVPA